MIIVMGGRVEAMHKIGIRQSGQGGEFYNRETGEKFVPRGVSYIRQEKLKDPWSGEILTHSTFHVGSYDGEKVDKALKEIKAQGYNLVRVFVMPVNENDLGEGRVGVRGQFWANVADFLKKAKANDLVVTLVFSKIPKLGYGFPNSVGNFQVENWYYLAEEGVEAKKRYLREAIEGIKKWGGPLEYVLNYEENEVYLVMDYPPLSYSSGVIKAANGKSYDMASAVQKKTMINEGVKNWNKQIEVLIKEMDPGAIVAPSFFSQAAVPEGMPWIVPEVKEVGAEVVDVHAYPGWLDKDLKTDLEKTLGPLGIAQIVDRPILMSELGMDKSRVTGGVERVATVLKSWQAESCRSYGVDGWTLWEWDDETQPHFWNATENDGWLGKELGAKLRVDPCERVRLSSADINSDGKVDLVDFVLWKMEYSGKVTTKKADLNRDNKVDLLDFVVWKGGYSEK